jgi:hypothetical protein
MNWAGNKRKKRAFYSLRKRADRGIKGIKTFRFIPFIPERLFPGYSP